MAPPLNVALYARVSTEEQARQGVSLAAQRESMEAYCAARGWRVYDTYIDDGYSGKDMERPGIQRLLKDAKENKFQVLLVWKLDRLSRRQFDILNTIENVLTPNGIGFKSVTESFDTTTPWGKAALSMMAVFAQLERETIVERTRLGIHKVMESGRWKGGRVPFGYDYTPLAEGGSGALQINPREGAVVKLIFHLYVMNQMGMEKIAAYLNGQNAEGRVYPTPRGGRHWTGSSVQRILMNPVYAGKLPVAGGLVEGRHESIVDGATWEEAQRMREHRRTWRPGRHYLLSGLLRCAVCGASLSGSSQWTNWPKRPKRYSYNYVCRNRRGSPNKAALARCDSGYHHGPTLEKKVLDIVGCLRMDRDAVNQVLSAASAGDPADPYRQIKALEASIRRDQAALSRYYEAFEAGALSPEQVGDRLRALREQLDDAVRQREKLLAASRESERFHGALLAAARDTMLAFHPVLHGAHRTELKAALANLIEEIRVGRKGEIVAIRWK